MDHVIETSKDAMKRLRHRVEDIADLRHELEHQVRREPLVAVGLALGTGLVVGAATGWAAVALHHHHANGGTRK